MRKGVAAQTRDGEKDVALPFEAAFDQHTTGADGLRIFGEERPLLRQRRRRVTQEEGRDTRLTLTQR